MGEPSGVLVGVAEKEPMQAERSEEASSKCKWDPKDSPQ